jgi:signal transduction histidine kinase
MAVDPVDPRWPKLLSLAVHEFRTPVTVVAGYLRMLLKERAGPISDQQRRLLEEAEKSCARLSSLLAEVSELSGLEGGTATFNRTAIDLRAVLGESVAGLSALPDREVAVDLQTQSGGAALSGDATRLRAALTSVISAMRREIVTSDRICVREQTRAHAGRQVFWIAISDPDRVETLAGADASSLTVFDEWRGGVGLSLAVARRIINAHGGSIWSPRPDENTPESRAAAVIALPQADAS